MFPFNFLRISRAYSSSPALANPARQCMVTVKDGIGLLTLNRAERKNAFGRQMVSELGEAIEFIQSSNDIRVTVVNSSVDRCFSAGADLKERASMSVEEAEAFVDLLRSTFHRISQIRVPTVAAIDGVALGGGLELALACDLRYAGVQAKIGLPETKLAILPAAGGSQRLPRQIGLAKAKELIFTARILNSTEALSFGIVNASGESALEASMRVAQEMLKNGPLALRMAKSAMDSGYGLDMIKALEAEKRCYATLLASKDRLEGLAAFKEGRTPVYRGQ